MFGEHVTYFSQKKSYFLFEVSVITRTKRKFRKGRSLKKSRSSVMATLFYSYTYTHTHSYQKKSVFFAKSKMSPVAVL